jgi:two-component system response regulator AlgR
LDDALSDLALRLGERFLRVHRNALVAKHAVRALERRSLPAADADEDGDAGGVGWAVQVAPLGEWLAVSRRQAAAVKAALGGH